MADQNVMLGPDNPSDDYKAMLADWQMVEAILGGAGAMREAAKTYLPKFPNESSEDYEHRRRWAPFTNIYADISRNLASKPFSRELTLKEGATPAFDTLIEDIDGLGNNLHVFGENVFQRGLDKGVDFIFCDHTKVEATRPLSIAEEQQIGARPYWVAVPAERMLALYTDRENGQEIVVHARIHEPAVVRDGYGEMAVNRVRVLDRQGADGAYAPATYQVFEQQKDKDGKPVWVSIEGPAPITIGIIPIVGFVTGKRKGSSWKIRPPLRDIAFLQCEAFQQESNLKSVLEATAFPMLVGNGVEKSERVPVGPRGVLFAEPGADGSHGEWKYIEPSAESIGALEAHLEATQKNMRDLGMQPLTTANLTVITTANVAMKAHSAVMAWSLALKDALEQALKFTAMWLGQTDAAPEVDIYTDFGVDFQAGTELDSLLKAQGQGILSKRTTQDEFKRRGVLSDNFDPDEEEKRLAEDEQGLEPEEAIDPITGERVEPSTRPLIIAKPAELSQQPTV